MKKISIIIILIVGELSSQRININNDYIYDHLRISILSGDLETDYSFNIRPLDYKNLSNHNQYFFYDLIKKKNFKVKFLGIDYFTEFNSHHPYKKNNGTMIPNRGYQHIISPGLFFELGPLSIKFKPEHHYSNNKRFDGFWEGHYSKIWAERYKLWNHIDMPERFGNNSHNNLFLGQSYVKLNWKNLSLGISNENIWWGPSTRNSIMMSNNAKGFKHLSFNSNKPLKTFIGDFEWQIIWGRLESSGFTPPRTDFTHSGTKIYVPKINQLGHEDDWRFLNAMVISYSPKFINGFSFGFIRWVQMYSALVEGKYTWMNGVPSYFPIFSNLFRKNDVSVDYESQTDQAAGIFFKWLWKKSNTEIYAEFHHNDSKENIRDLLLDSDHSRAVTVGIQKYFKIAKGDFLFSWEWTQMEQNASRLVRNAGSWYEHTWVFHGYTNNGEVLGSAIGPGSNVNFFSLSKLKRNEKIGIALEIVDNDNDFYHDAFAQAGDYRRYWKDFNLHLMYNRKFKSLIFSSDIVYGRSLNYQWELDDKATPYYHPGRDINNLHFTFKLTYYLNYFR